MSTYYIPPIRQHSQSDASYRSSTTLITDVESPRQQEIELQLDQSIYIFPTPSSVPASPCGSSSSVFSAPSDFTEAFSVSAGTRSREQSFSSSAAARSRSPQHRRRHSTRNGVALSDTYRSWSRARSGESDGYDPEVEIWDWTAESGEDVPDDDGLWEFEAEVERASRWDIPTNLVRRLSPLRALDTGPTTDFYEHHYRIIHRSRTQSNTSSLTSATTKSSLPVSVVHTPHPRIHIPLLSFFASLLSLNLDEPGLRVLTHSTSDSILFPGQSNLLDGGAGWSVPEDDAPAPSPHGLLRLHLSDDGPRSATRTLKEGLVVACDSAALSNPFSLPGFSALAGFYRFVGGVWSNGGKAWREVQDTGSLPVS